MIIGHASNIEDLTALADKKALGHGHIFFGERRAGKRQVALGLARYLETGIFGGEERRPLSDALTIVPDEKNTIGIDAIREIKNFLRQMPNMSAYRTIVIDGGEFLTDHAQNALLKIAEEPPAHALMIIVIDDYERLLPTLQSRMQKRYFGAVSAREVKQWLLKTLRVPAAKAEEISKKSFGLPGLAWAMLHDAKFQEFENAVGQFFALAGNARKDFLKDLTAADEDNPFHFDAFLEALAIACASSNKKDSKLWHRVMKLRRDADFFNVNSRLQLTALASTLK